MLQMKEKPSQMSYDWSKFKGSSEEPSEERSEKHDKVHRCQPLCVHMLSGTTLMARLKSVKGIDHVRHTPRRRRRLTRSGALETPRLPRTSWPMMSSS